MVAPHIFVVVVCSRQSGAVMDRKLTYEGCLWTPKATTKFSQMQSLLWRGAERQGGGPGGGGAGVRHTRA